MHASDCSIYNAPAMTAGPCDCGGIFPAAVTPDMPGRTVALLARIDKLEDALKQAQSAIAECLMSGGMVDDGEWWDHLVDAQQTIAASLRSK